MYVHTYTHTHSHTTRACMHTPHTHHTYHTHTTHIPHTHTHTHTHTYTYTLHTRTHHIHTTHTTHTPHIPHTHTHIRTPYTHRTHTLHTTPIFPSFLCVGSTPLDLFKFYIEELKVRYHDQKKIIKDILRDGNFAVETVTPYEEFQKTLLSDSRSNACDLENMKLVFESVSGCEGGWSGSQWGVRCV